ncbi:selenocysteine insertion sequence-binding protein 2 isoform X5 [Sturnira hondurensis]|uniref:selenocysteine insertion sequence-binding protein 2 isoform X5 n=1 Tax=Sturnira hondurensis TaxID=192404 RepID=UPI001879FC47|nr:selenocysteine insertion sequence-binding protein 2 isoform X5 [Sturnira hondurensis]
MASEGPRQPAGEGIKLSADVKPFIPKFAGLRVAWLESSEAHVFPSCAATYYPCVQELPLPEQKLYPEDTAFGASTFPHHCLSSEMALHPYTCSYNPESTQNVCPVPSSQYDYSQSSRYQGFQRVKPQYQHVSPPPQDTKALFKKKMCHEQKFDSKKADGTILSDTKSVKGSHHMSICADTTLKSDGYFKRTDRRSRIIEKCGPSSKPEFEFTRLDFPELQGGENNEILETPKQPKWGPSHSAATDTSLVRELVKPTPLLAEGETVVKNNNLTDSVTDNADTNPSSCTRELSWTPMGYVVRQTLSTEPSPAPRNVTPVINLKTVVSSADPKNGNILSSHVLSSSDSSYNREKPIGHSTKKDAEEFPNLAVASERRDRVEAPKFQLKRQPQNNFKSGGKKSQIPVQLDLGGMLTALEKKQHSQSPKQASKAVVFSVGAVPILSKEATSGKKGHRFSQANTPHNPLDSSAPLMKKGKQREIPKAKKPTSLKKIILKEREERKQQRLQENAVSPAVDDMQDVESGGDDLALEQAPGKTEVSVCSTPAVESSSEEPLETEIHKEVATCYLVPEGASCPKIHSRRFRDYCSQVLSKEVDACVTDLLKELVRFQDRMYQKDPVKAKTKRRLVLGLREVLKHLKLRKLKCVIISPNCEKIQSKGGLDDTLHTIISYACEQNIPFVFALNRKALGRSLNKAVPVSVVGIFSYDGAQESPVFCGQGTSPVHSLLSKDQFHKMVELTMAAREAYKTMLENVHRELAEEPGLQAPASLPAQGTSCSAEDTASSKTEEPYYIQVWRKHLEAYSHCALELEESLESSTSQMMNLNL